MARHHMKSHPYPSDLDRDLTPMRNCKASLVYLSYLKKDEGRVQALNHKA